MKPNQKSLGNQEQFCLRAAEGWLELGNWAEAELELGKIDAVYQNHLDVLQVRWHISARRNDWKQAVEIGQAMVKQDPDLPTGWINYANAYFFQKEYNEAYNTLLPALDRFPRNPYLRYNLACYKCQLHEHEKALSWIKKAFALGDARELREMALKDRDLEPLWSDIVRL